MKVLVTGANGQLGYELQKTCPADIQLIATDFDTLDITQFDQIDAAFEQHQPNVVINAAAYTAVDKAESEPVLADLINHEAVRMLAKVATRQGVRMIQISTDFVFDGHKSTPYTPYDTPIPTSVYGRTKYAGEYMLRTHQPYGLIIRTSWLYSTHGYNFVKTMLDLMATKPSLNIIADQIGTPTWARTLANTVWAAISTPVSGTLHCSDNGVATWYDFAVAIQEEALQLGLLENKIPLTPIPSSAYPTAATRPHYSVMDKSDTEQHLGYALPHWRESLRQMLQELKEGTTQ